MGRHRYRKTVVEDCITLTVNDVLRRFGRLRGGNEFVLSLSRPDDEHDQFRLPCRVEGKGQGLSVHVGYFAEDDHITYSIRMEGTRAHYGGLRWFFRCPLSIDDQACERRVKKLYMPPDSKYFGCRCCQDLTYMSVRQPASTHIRRFCKSLEDLSRELGTVEGWEGEVAVDTTRLAVLRFLESWRGESGQGTWGDRE